MRLIVEAQRTRDVVCPEHGLVDRVYERPGLGVSYELAMARHVRRDHPRQEKREGLVTR